MPRLYHRPPKYRLHKSTRQAVVSLHGKVIQLGPYGSEQSHRRYGELIAEWRKSRHQHPPGASRPPKADEEETPLVTVAMLRARRRSGLPIPLDELILVYVQHCREYYRKNGEVTREAGQVAETLRFLRKHFPDHKAEAFTPDLLDELRDRMIDDLDWSRKFINKQVRRIIGMFKWGVEKGVVDVRVLHQLRELTGLKKGRTRARETSKVTVVEDAVIEATLPRMPEIIADMVRLQRLTGARPGEICSLRPCDLDRTDPEVWVYRPSEHKTEHYEKDRLIMIGPQGRAVLLPYLVRAEESFCFSPAESVQRRIRRQTGKQATPSVKAKSKAGSNQPPKPKWRPSGRYRVASYRLAIRRACLKAGVETWSPNRLRHTAATEVRQKFGLEAAQVVCGHQSADVTQIYAERDLELVKRVAREVG